MNNLASSLYARIVGEIILGVEASRDSGLQARPPMCRLEEEIRTLIGEGGFRGRGRGGSRPGEEVF